MLCQLLLLLLLLLLLCVLIKQLLLHHVALCLMKLRLCFLTLCNCC